MFQVYKFLKMFIKKVNFEACFQTLGFITVLLHGFTKHFRVTTYGTVEFFYRQLNVKMDKCKTQPTSLAISLSCRSLGFHFVLDLQLGFAKFSCFLFRICCRRWFGRRRR